MERWGKIRRRGGSTGGRKRRAGREGWEEGKKVGIKKNGKKR